MPQPPADDTTDAVGDDDVPPVVRFVAPFDGTVVSGELRIEVSATDNRGIASVTLRVGDQEIARLTASPYVRG